MRIADQNELEPFGNQFGVVKTINILLYILLFFSFCVKFFSGQRE
jgi:hypothetical protein